MSKGPQKPDHRGNFFIVPKHVIGSVAWRHLSCRAQSVLQVLQSCHNGFNNGHIALGIHKIGEVMGNQNHGANSRAVSELIQKGFLECTSDANRHQMKVREYRLTFIPTGAEGSFQKATNDHLFWRPPVGVRKKFGRARTATQDADSVAVTATDRKVSSAETAPPRPESCGSGIGSRVAVTARHICNHPRSEIYSGGDMKFPPASSAVPKGIDPRVDIDELRDWMNAAMVQLGYGAARQLANDAGIPEPAISRFRNGKSLPDQYRLLLQQACGRVLGKRKRKELAE